MSHLRYSNEEIDRRGEALYERQLRAQVETEENIGKINYGGRKQWQR